MDDDCIGLSGDYTRVPEKRPRCLATTTADDDSRVQVAAQPTAIQNPSIPSEVEGRTALQIPKTGRLATSLAMDESYSRLRQRLAALDHTTHTIGTRTAGTR